jgi:RNase H
MCLTCEQREEPFRTRCLVPRIFFRVARWDVIRLSLRMRLVQAPPLMKRVMIHTDGGCKGNPGPGGFGVVMVSGKHRKELSAGYRLTTNNRMELRAAIAALESRMSLVPWSCTRTRSI